MKKLLSLLASFIIFASFPKAAIAIYDPVSVPNNKFGIGIINTSDLGDAATLVNSSDGDWGYTTIVIPKNQRDKNMWQAFFDEARRKHVIPIIRVATNLSGDSWKIPDVNDIDSWVNFFNSLNWVTENRYVIIGNEPNQAKEWGGKVDPEAYALYLKTFAERLRNSSKDYFVLPAGFDSSAPNSRTTLDEWLFLRRMEKEVPNIFDYIDGWTSHSYPNPAFSGSEKDIGRKSIRNYEWETEVLKGLGNTKDFPVFITETGWSRANIDQAEVGRRLTYAFNEVWSKNKQIVAVTPFILNYPAPPFDEFSWKDKNGDFYDFYKTVHDLAKEKGLPKQKTSGEILFNVLQPIGTAGGWVNGILIVSNAGQTIWDSTNMRISEENGETLESHTEGMQTIEPFRKGIILYKIKIPFVSKNIPISISFYASGEKIGESLRSEITIIRIKYNFWDRFLDWARSFGKIR